jgi:hypothetical protein
MGWRRRRGVALWLAVVVAGAMGGCSSGRAHPSVWAPRLPPRSDPEVVARTLFTDFIGMAAPPGRLSPFRATGASAGAVDVAVSFPGWSTTTTVALAKTSGGWAVTEVRTPEVTLSHRTRVRAGRLVVEGFAHSPSGVVQVELKPVAPGGGAIRLGVERATVAVDAPSPFSVAFDLGTLRAGTPLVVMARVSSDAMAFDPAVVSAFALVR